MIRSEHIAWCKERALQYLEQGDVYQAYASMISDLGKHSETKDHIAIGLGMQLFKGAVVFKSISDMRKFIEGFN